MTIAGPLLRSRGWSPTAASPRCRGQVGASVVPSLQSSSFRLTFGSWPLRDPTNTGEEQQERRSYRCWRASKRQLRNSQADQPDRCSGQPDHDPDDTRSPSPPSSSWACVHQQQGRGQRWDQYDECCASGPKRPVGEAQHPSGSNGGIRATRHGTDLDKRQRESNRNASRQHGTCDGHRGLAVTAVTAVRALAVRAIAVPITSSDPHFGQSSTSSLRSSCTSRRKLRVFARVFLFRIINTKPGGSA